MKRKSYITEKKIIWIKLDKMKWSRQNNHYIKLVDNICCICGIEKDYNCDSFYKCNSDVCCFIRSLPSQIPNAYHNYKMKILHNNIKKSSILLKYISNIIIDYMPLIDVSFNKYYRCKCGHSTNYWKPGYLCNTEPCLTDRMFNELE